MLNAWFGAEADVGRGCDGRGETGSDACSVPVGMWADVGRLGGTENSLLRLMGQFASHKNNYMAMVRSEFRRAREF